MNSGLLKRIKLLDTALSILSDTERNMNKYTKEFMSFGTKESVSEFLNGSSTTSENIIDPILLEFNHTGLRRLYHKIALMLHPDKGGNKNDAHILSQATSEYKSYNLAGLIVIYRQIINDDITLIGPKDFPLLDHNIISIQKKITSLMENHIWKFGQKTPKDRETYAKSFWSKKST
jgi:hypothetical protein